MDADIILFSPSALLEAKSPGFHLEEEEDDPSSLWVMHVMVQGEFVVKKSHVVMGLFPGHPVSSKPLIEDRHNEL